MTTNNTDEKLFGFHFGKGCHVSLWADSQKSAIDRFRKMMGTDLVFITDAEWKRRETSLKRLSNPPDLSEAL